MTPKNNEQICECGHKRPETIILDCNELSYSAYLMYWEQKGKLCWDCFCKPETTLALENQSQQDKTAMEDGIKSVSEKQSKMITSVVPDKTADTIQKFGVPFSLNKEQYEKIKNFIVEETKKDILEKIDKAMQEIDEAQENYANLDWIDKRHAIKILEELQQSIMERGKGE